VIITPNNATNGTLNAPGSTLNTPGIAPGNLRPGSTTAPIVPNTSPTTAPGASTTPSVTPTGGTTGVGGQ
jgi:hypothetical protein